MSEKRHPPMPAVTIETLARSVFEQATSYGFTRIDHVRLASALLSLCNAPELAIRRSSDAARGTAAQTAELPAHSDLLASSQRLHIHALDSNDPRSKLLEAWLQDLLSAHFILSSATTQPRSLHGLLTHPQNVFGLMCLHGGQPVGAVAYLDRDELHARAELRILIGEPRVRRHGYALEGAKAWLEFGFTTLDLEKIFVQLPEGDVRSLRLFEQLGFAIEAVLPGELRIGGERQNAVRCAILRDATMAAPGAEMP